MSAQSTDDTRVDPVVGDKRSDAIVAIGDYGTGPDAPARNIESHWPCTLTSSRASARTEPGLLLHRMVTGLIASGELIPQWREAFASVPRHVFIPDLV